MRWRGRKGHGHERGQGLVEFTLVVPIIVLVLVSVAEIGLAFGNTHTLGYGSREGARVGSALATGGVIDCNGGLDPAGVDKTLVAAVQRILKSPGSGIDIGKVEQIRIFKATSAGEEESDDLVNIWTFVGEGNGVDVDPDSGWIAIDFFPTGGEPWSACSRVNSGSDPDSIGVTVRYRYDFVSPLPQMVDAITGGNLFLTLEETTVMSLNPSV